MGVCASVGFDTFPAQGAFLGKSVEVMFRYDSSRRVRGEIVRDDAEAPWRTLIRLSDGRFIDSAECQYRLVDAA